MDALVSGVGVESVAYHQDTVRTQFDPEKTAVSTVVVATLAEMIAADPVELDPLYNTVDPDALDAIVRIRNGTDGDIRVSFTHEDHAVTVFSYGVVTIAPGTDHTSDIEERVAGE